MAGQHQAADDAADGLVPGLLRVEEGRLGQPVPVTARQLDEFTALSVVDEPVRRVQDVHRLEQGPHRARPVADGVRARFEYVTGVRLTRVASPEVRVAGVVLGEDPFAQMEGEAAVHGLGQARVLRTLPGEGEEGGDAQ